MGYFNTALKNAKKKRDEEIKTIKTTIKNNKKTQKRRNYSRRFGRRKMFRKNKSS